MAPAVRNIGYLLKASLWVAFLEAIGSAMEVSENLN